jgi:Putative metallopeptidase
MGVVTVKRPLAALAAGAVLLLAAGCGGTGGRQADTKSPAAQSSTETSHAPAEPTSGRVRIRYEDAHTPDAQRGRQLMQNAKLLEELAAHVEDTLLLPSDMGAVGKQCDQPNDFYEPNANEIQLCYESIQHSEQNFAGNGNPDPAAAAVDAETSGYYHELGHAVLAVYRLAFTGREEDVADQLSAFTLLSPGADGKPYPNGVRIATNAATDWKLSAKEVGDANELPFWDGHSMDITRMYNWECWIYGSDPAANASIVASGDLPEDRAGNCEEEFQNMEKGWQQLLGPHLRKPS